VPEKHGIPFTGIDNASDEIEALANPQMDLKNLPFDPLEYIEHLSELPFDPDLSPGIGD
jgi:arylsulfatase